MSISGQMSLLGEAKVEVPEPNTKVRLGNKIAEIPLRKRRREALQKLMPILEQLEGKDVFIGSYWSANNHFWVNNLKLSRMKLVVFKDKDEIPSVIVLWGNRDASVRIFTDQLVAVRQQEYGGYTLWILDFWNGFGDYPIDPHRPIGYVSLSITQFKD